MAGPDALALSDESRRLREAGRLPEALEAIDAALALGPVRPRFHNRRGIVLRALGRHEEALASFHHALAMAPDYVSALCNVGHTLHDLGHPEAALPAYERALQLDPRHADTHWNMSLALLALGHFDEGWHEYEWRHRVPSIGGGRREFPMPAWNLQDPVDGRRVLVHAEQGLGDTLQFCRYLPWLASQGAVVIFGGPATLRGLIESLQGVAHFVEEGAPLPAADLHCPLMSLPLAARLRRFVVAVPGAYLAADRAKAASWRARLADQGRPLIGIAWSGRVGHGNDGQRSMAFEAMARHLPAGPTYVSLQQFVREGDRSALAASAVRDVSADLRDFSDTAALCAVLDLVVSVDTSVAHLAAALGRRVELLLPANPDWRWGVAGDRTAWYPTMRLWRQPSRGDWEPALVKLAAVIEKEVACSS